MRSSPRAFLGLAAAAGCALAFVACDVPTSLPVWNTVWQVPAKGAEVSVADILPSSVSVVDIGGGAKAFSLALPAAGINTSLGSVCGCAAANGSRAPKPAFTLVDSATVTLPSDVASADVVGGRIDYTITNGFSFDALNPSATAHGWLRVRVRAGTTTLAKDSVAGPAMTLPTNVARNRSIPLQASPAAPVHLAGPLTVDVTLFSPAGDSVTINTSETFQVSAQANGLQVSQASVNVPSKSIPTQADTVDLSGLQSMTTGALAAGAVILTVQNPFAVQGSLTVDMKTSTTTITKTLNLPLGGPGTAPSTLRLDLSRSEINALVGEKNVVLSVSGGVNAPGAVTVTPTQKIVLNTMVEATITSGGK